MYHLVPLPAAPTPRPRRKSIILGFIAVLAFSLLDAASLGAVALSLPAATHAYWFISRSSGVVAYVLITLSVLWGLVQSGSLLSPRTLPGLPFGLHSLLSWLGLGLAALHGMVLLGDRYIGFDLAQLTMPFLSTYRPLPTGLGIVSFYLVLLLTLSFYARPHLSQKNFRLLHYTSFGAICAGHASRHLRGHRQRATLVALRRQPALRRAAHGHADRQPPPPRHPSSPPP